ncbi:hypothetical protein Tco_1370982 [Tanacetum coccineum]
MAELPICDELRRSVGKVDWEPQFILRCSREISEDVRLAREINALCMRLTAIVDEREAFADELDMLTGKYVTGKMAEFTKQVQNKDIPNLMKLQILGREFELRAQEKELFIEKLKGLFWTADGWSKRDLFVDFSRFVLASFWSFERSVIVAWVGGGVPDVDRYMLAISMGRIYGLGAAVVATCEPSFFVACGSETTKEVGEDLARVREYKGVVFGLNIGMQRREECIGELKALGDCQDVIETVRFMERLQQDDMEKRDRSLLLMREMEVKAREKSRFILKLSADSSEWCDVLTYLCREAADEDRNIATKLNRLREEMLIICEKRRNIADELRSVRGIVVVQKAAEFVAETVGYAHGMPLPRELADATGSTDVKDQLRRDAYIEEFQRLEMYNSSDEVIETIEILKGMQVDDMEKASRLILMAREIDNRVYQIYDFITKLRQ